MDFLGFDDETIERFSVWQMTSNRGLNLLLQEAFANQLSGVIRRGTTRIAGRIMASLDNVVDDIVSNSRAVSASEQSWLMRRVDDLFQWVDKPEWAPAAKTVLGGIMSYVGLVGEVVFEMAFESAFNADEEGRPAGGPAMFAIAMTLSVVTQTAMTRLATGIVDSPSAYRKQMKIQLSLVLVSMSLSVAQIYMRYPVMMANMK
jgi:hypothetical protein